MICSAPLERDTWQLESQEVYYRPERGTTWHSDDNLPAIKAQVVIELLSGAKSTAELCREHQFSSQLLAQWKRELLERAPQIFEQDQVRRADQERIAELERLVGRLTMQLEIAKKPRRS